MKGQKKGATRGSIMNEARCRKSRLYGRNKCIKESYTSTTKRKKRRKKKSELDDRNTRGSELHSKEEW
jgi:hypothetical protein